MHPDSKAATRIAVLDPSGFTLPYDYCFCRALAATGSRVWLFTRELRRGEPAPPTQVNVQAGFYGRSEHMMRRWPRLAAGIRLLKGIEHGTGLRAFERWCQAERPDVIHFQWTALPILDRMLVRHLRGRSLVVFTVHDTKAFLGSASSRLQYWGWRSILENVDRLIVHTEDGVRHLREQGVRTPIAVVPHGPLEFPEPPANIAEEPEILLFGELKPYKGADLLIRAFAQVPPDVRAGWRVRIAGKPQMDAKPMMETAESLGIGDAVLWDLRYVGEDEIAPMMARASIMAFPYRHIDTSGVLMGSLGFRKPVVASRIGVFAELLRDGESALLVEREDVPGLARALERLMAAPELRRRLADASHAAFRSRVPGWNSIAGTMIDLYRADGERVRAGNPK